MKTRFSIIVMMMLLASVGSAQTKQMSPPRVMVVPDDTWCRTNGYTVKFENQGKTVIRPDYENAMTSKNELTAVITQLNELISNRNDRIELVDLIQTIDNLNADMAMQEANDGDESESVDEAIIRNSQADILVKVNFNIEKNGPQKIVHYQINGIDAYTGNRIAPIDGVGTPSTSAAAGVLIREAIFGKMDSFLDKLLGHYQNVVKYGRSISMNFKIQSGSSVDMESIVGEYSLREVIDDCLYDLSFNGEGEGLEGAKGGRTFLSYPSIKIPLVSDVRGRQRRISASSIAQKVQNELQGKYGLQCSYKQIGLGKVNFYISK